MDKYQKIFCRAAECRIFLNVHGFLTTTENEKVQTRINKYGDTNKVNKFRTSPSSVDEKRKQAIQNGFDDYCESNDLPYRNECPLCPPLTDELPQNPSNFTDGLT